MVSIRKILAEEGLKKRAWGDYRDNVRAEAAKNCIFHFSTPGCMALWPELMGQISDGAWENTPGTGWVFWAYIPTRVDGQTHISGSVPMGLVKTGFNFGMLVDIVGDQWLEAVQKVEPTATMATVIKYMKEIKDAMKRLRTTQTPVGVLPPPPPSKAKPLPAPAPSAPSQAPSTPGTSPSAPAPAGTIPLPDEITQVHAHLLMVRSCFDEAEISPISLREIVAESFLYASSGGRAGQFHYFCIIRDGGTSGMDPRYAACSAYGKFGNRTPKGVVLGKNLQLEDAKKLVKGKARTKMSSGYQPTSLEGIRWSMDVITGVVKRT